MRNNRLSAIGIVLAAGILFPSHPASGEGRFGTDLLKAFSFRALGPYRAGSWVTDFAVPDFPDKAHLYTYYVATRNGGVWKTTNNGTTFEPVFDGQESLSIGDIALAPSNPEILWVGTGEAHCARSSNAGDGVYKSEDGGKTWSHMGLRDSQHIARIVVHPKNPEVVYVAAVGHLFSPNEERGVFKTADGGRTWQKVLYINPRVGAIDLVMNNSNPDVLYAASYEYERRAWHFVSGGPESGIYKTVDGGKTWTRLAGGLPSGKIGRIGLDIFQKRPETLYAVVENANPRPLSAEEKAEAGRRGLSAQDSPISGEVYKTTDGGGAWTKVNTGKESLATKAPYSFNQIRVDQIDENMLYVTGVTLASSEDGGKTWVDADWPMTKRFLKAFGDVRTLWVDPLNSDRLLFGSDGGVHVTYDRGLTCDHLANLPLGEFYAIGVDMADPYNIYGGLQDHDSWKGPSNGWSGEVAIADWVTVGGGDGMYNQVDPADPRWIYNNREFGAMWRFDQKTGIATSITPKRESGREPYRFNWTPPIHLSPHDSKVVYTGAQVLLRSPDRGARWEEASPNLTTDDKEKIAAGRFVTYCTITTISESPLAPGLIWVGTDDGKVQVTKDAGKTWTDCTAAVAAAGGPENVWVSRIFASPHDAATAFVAKTGMRFDDFHAYLFKTTDYGQSWASLGAGLPEKPLNAVVQDAKNPDLLFIGTDHGLYVSISGGRSWTPFQGAVPWVKVTDLIIHPRENDLIVATYGRGLYITDITALQEMTEKVLEEDVHLFAVEPRAQRTGGPVGNYQLLGDRYPTAPNEPDAVVIRYYLRDKSPDKAKVTVADSAGKVLAELEGAAEAGINAVLWDMRAKAEGADRGEWWNRRRVEPGEYIVTLEASGRKLAGKALIKERTAWSVGPFPVVVR